MGPIPLPEPPLANGDVALRPWRPQDVPAIVAACQDPEIPKWTLVPSPYSADDARLWLAAQSAARRGGRRVELAIVDGKDRLLGSIVGFRIEISRLEGKWKLSQNHPEERRRRVVRALETQPDEDAQTIAALMRQGLGPA